MMQQYEYEVQYAQTARTLPAECAVLLIKNGHFPLKEPDRIAL